MRQKTEEGAVPLDNREPVEIRVIRDQKEVRGVLGNKVMDGLLDEAHQSFAGHTSNPGAAYIFLVFTDDGKGTVWMSDSLEQNVDSDEDVVTVRKKMARIWGETRELQYWLQAKKLKGWTD